MHSRVAKWVGDHAIAVSRDTIAQSGKDRGANKDSAFSLSSFRAGLKRRDGGERRGPQQWGSD